MSEISGTPGKGARIVGWILTGIVSFMLLMSASMKFIKPPGFEDGLKHLGWENVGMTGIGIIELLCVVFYLIPKTRVLGAILITGYLGGAIATHVRVSDLFIIPLLLGMAAWGGLYLRDMRIRELIPFN